MPQNNSQDTFNPADVLKTLEKHEKAFLTVDRPEQFAQKFVEIANESTKITTYFQDKMKDMIRCDTTFRESIKGLIGEVEKDRVMYVLKSFKGLFILIGGSALTLLIQFFIKKLELFK